MRRKVVFFPPHFFVHYKNVALFALRDVFPCVPAYISHKSPMLIYSLYAYHLLHNEFFLQQHKRS